MNEFYPLFLIKFFCFFEAITNRYFHNLISRIADCWSNSYYTTYSSSGFFTIQILCRTSLLQPVQWKAGITGFVVFWCVS